MSMSITQDDADEFGENFINNLSVAQDLAADGWNVFIEGDELVAEKDGMNIAVQVAQNDRDAEEQLAEFLEGKDSEFIIKVTRACLDYEADERAWFYEAHDLEVAE